MTLEETIRTVDRDKMAELLATLMIDRNSELHSFELYVFCLKRMLAMETVDITDTVVNSLMKEYFINKIDTEGPHVKTN